MFKKLVSNLPFNPSLIEQVSFYAKRLHSEDRVRRSGFIMVILAVLVQMFAVISPPEPTMARSANDIIPGGFATKSLAVEHCRKNNYDFRTILSHFGISCDAVANSTTKNIRSTDYDRKLLSLGRLPYGKAGERSVIIAGKTYHQRYLWSWDSGLYSTYKSLVGNRSDGTPFIILFNCGNPTIVESPPPPPPPPPPPAPSPSPPPATPVDRTGFVKCSELIAIKLGPQTYRFTAATTGESYITHRYLFDFGDGNKESIFSQNRSFSVDHHYNDFGKYIINATIEVVLVNSSGPVSTAARCKTSIDIANPDVCPHIPGIQTSLDQCDVCPDVPGVQTTEVECKPCEKSQDGNDSTACLILSKQARNDTRNIANADGTLAQAGDDITYTLTVKSTSQFDLKDFVVEENVADILDYADILDAHGGIMDDNFIMRWPAIDIPAGGEISQTLAIKVKDPVPQTPASITNPGTFDLVMTNVYGNTINIKLPPSVTKTTEQVVQTLPNTGPGESMVAATLFTVFVGYFFTRTRLFAKELDIIKTDYATDGGY